MSNGEKLEICGCPPRPGNDECPYVEECYGHWLQGQEDHIPTSVYHGPRP